MNSHVFGWFAWGIAAFSSIAACGGRLVQPLPPQPPTLTGTVSYDSGSPAGGALVAITDLKSGSQAKVVAADAEGRFEASLVPGKYALAVTADRGFAWIEAQQVPNTNSVITVSESCHAVTGQATGAGSGTRINFARVTNSKGDTFVSDVRKDGSFAVCLPESHFAVFLTGHTISLVTELSVPTPASVQLQGFADRDIRKSPRSVPGMPSDMSNVVSDIVRSSARLIGLGEATHGTAELVSARGTLTLDLIRHADARLVLIEADAVAGSALDDYVAGADIDVAKAVTSLGFWVTDTYEFLHFLDELRQYNATSSEKVHIWGIDVQNTALPVGVLVTNATALSLTPEDVAMLTLIADRRGRGIEKLSSPQRSNLDALLSRLAAPRNSTIADLRIAVAARSLVVQLGYLSGDVAANYGARRDAGMAALATFLVEQTGVKRACVWAHAGHVAKELDLGRERMGRLLAAKPANRYYAIGFYLYQGSARAWDAAGEIGVVSNTIPAAPEFTIEGALMAATGAPEIAWVPIHAFSTELQEWTKTPRFVREVGAVYGGVENMMVLRRTRDAFNAIVVVRTGHDSSPTPSGIRKITRD
jgi:erythromycin esterase